MKNIYLFLVSIFFVGFSQANQSVLILGNSISLHGPSAEIGWSGSWGMAASSGAKDFIALLSSRLNADRGSHYVYFHRRNVSKFEKSPAIYYPLIAQEVEKWSPDLVVFFLGDNVADGNNEMNEFFSRFTDALYSLKSKNINVICVGTWWASVSKDKQIMQRCESAGGVFVSLGGLSKQESNLAKSDNPSFVAGVGIHPGDRGMQEIYQRLLPAVESVLGPN